MGGTGQTLAPQYLGLLLRMDPQFSWFKVVAGNKPLLQCSTTEPESRKQRCAHQCPQHRTAQRHGEGWMDGRKRVAGAAPQKALPCAARTPGPQAHPRSSEYLPVEHDRGPVVTALLQDEDDVPRHDLELLWCLRHKPKQHPVGFPFQSPAGGGSGEKRG